MPIRARLRALIGTAVMRGLAGIALLLTSLIIARAFAPAEAAGFFATLTASQIAVPLLLLGLNGFLVKEAPRARGAADLAQWFGHGLFLVLLAGAGALVLVLLWRLMTGESGQIGGLSLSYILVFAPLSALTGYGLQAQKRFGGAVFILHLLHPLLIGGLVLLAGISGWTSRPAPLREGIFLLTGLAGLSLGLWFLRLSFGGIWPRPRPFFRLAALLRGEALAEVLRIWAVYALLTLMLFLPQMVFYHFGPAEDFSFFSLGQRLGALVVFFTVIANFTLAPELASRLSEPAPGGGRDQEGVIQRLFLRAMLISSGLALPLALLLIFAPGLALAPFGPGYSGAAPYLQICAACQFLHVLTGPSNMLLLMGGRAGRLLRDLVIGLCLSLLLMALLGPFWGGRGFALAFGLGLIGQSLLSLQAALGLLRR